VRITNPAANPRVCASAFVAVLLAAACCLPLGLITPAPGRMAFDFARAGCLPVPGPSTRRLPPVPGPSTRRLPPVPGPSTRRLPSRARAEHPPAAFPCPGRASAGCFPVPGPSIRRATDGLAMVALACSTRAIALVPNPKAPPVACAISR